MKLDSISIGKQSMYSNLLLSSNNPETSSICSSDFVTSSNCVVWYDNESISIGWAGLQFRNTLIFSPYMLSLYIINFSMFLLFHPFIWCNSTICNCNSSILIKAKLICFSILLTLSLFFLNKLLHEFQCN